MVRISKGASLYLALLAALCIWAGPYFAANISWLLSQEALTGLITYRFDFVVLYVALFSAFALFLLVPMGSGRWQKSNVVYIAFIIALFTEMFGFPLTVFLLSSLAPLPHAASPPSWFLTVSLPGISFRVLTTSAIAGAVSAVSALFIILGWRQIFGSRRSGKLVESGIYRFMRHPQYTGILLLTAAWLFAWPTLPTILMWPVLAAAYYRLARREEKAMLARFGKRYGSYMGRVPMFLPFWNA